MLHTTNPAAAAEVQQGSTDDKQSLLDAQLELWHHTFGYVKSMALKAALDLRIADAIHHHGGTAMLAQIATRATLRPSKLPFLRLLMRVLTVTGVFSSCVRRPAVDDGDEDERAYYYSNTPASRLLVGAPGDEITPFLALILDGTFIVSPFLGLGAWLQRDKPPEQPSLFETVQGKNPWDLASREPAFGSLFNEGMVADSGFIMDIVIKECGDVFRGVSSLVDVGGGLGGVAQAISKAFPNVKCSVLDFSHIVADAPAGTNSAMYLCSHNFSNLFVWFQWVLHDWGDAECVKILKTCRKAIPPREEGGKVIILDMVVGAGSSDLQHKETQVLFDLFIMFVNGIERNEQGWKKIIFDAGFSDYKIIPVLGVRSIVEVYPKTRCNVSLLLVLGKGHESWERSRVSLWNEMKNGGHNSLGCSLPNG
ncbi:O-methyltransferase ZRP4-like [Setaria italica]|uniref:O-methyltransferase ZRP4-like n=1 Tax=Setaria italica TaxID=4555 RepID=UPI0006478297|nr:O-methyltransferase ZRP4-like [Setaria italica]